ncbi:hypothetical protein [Aquitalea magnusonii]|uniref:hypothetical protein n=1 Tax=Aquitalea magnusonii TaxID=332411 RepID=UPI000750429C|nr:hypothetical protein [Aquitalea magnusonii]
MLAPVLARPAGDAAGKTPMITKSPPSADPLASPGSQPAYHGQAILLMSKEKLLSKHWQKFAACEVLLRAAIL